MVLCTILSSCRAVYVVVVPLKKGRGPIRHIKSPDELDLEEVNKPTASFLKPLSLCRRHSGAEAMESVLTGALWERSQGGTITQLSSLPAGKLPHLAT